MQINAVWANSLQKLDNMKNATKPIEAQPKTTQGYAPVTANLWGAKTSNIAFNYGSFIPDFGASRPTNNPVGFDKMEADTQSGFRLSSLEHPVICPDCGKPVMTKPIFAAIKGELDKANESTYLDVIENHSEFLYPQERKILSKLESVKAKKPDMTIRAIVSHEREKRLDKLERQQYKVMDKIGEMAEDLSYEDRSKVDGLLTVTSDVIFQRQNTYAFQRGKFIELAGQLDLHDEKAKSQLLHLNGHEPTPEEIAEYLEMPCDKVREILRVAQDPVSLETPIGEEEDSHLGDFIPDDDALAPADAASMSLLKEQLAEVLKTLTPREEKVLSLRFGLEDGNPKTLEEVGKEFNVTRERIRQIEAKALRKLRHPSRSKKLKDFLD